MPKAAGVAVPRRRLQCSSAQVGELSLRLLPGYLTNSEGYAASPLQYVFGANFAQSTTIRDMRRPRAGQ